jgi:hypothetical protein
LRFRLLFAVSRSEALKPEAQAKDFEAEGLEPEQPVLRKEDRFFSLSPRRLGYTFIIVGAPILFTEPLMDSKTYVPSRRDFAKAMAVLAAAAVPSEAQEGKQPDAKTYSAAVETIIRSRFGNQLSEQQIDIVRSSYMRHRESAKALYRVQLANGDDPIVAFRADLP